MRRFYAAPDNFQNDEVTLGLDETRHLRDVLRLNEGEQIQIFDGDGKEFLCEIERIEKRRTQIKVIREIAPKSAESNLYLTLAVALLKGEKFDLVVQKSAELGVSKIIPLVTKRCDVKIRDAKDAAKRLERWQRIALEAAKQSGRARLLKIETPANFADFTENSTAQISSGEKFILFAERNGESFSQIEANGKITAIIGAEGGWEDAEIETAREKGFQVVTFKGRVLRAETAAIAIAAVIQHRFGDFN
ncbi:MAG TPA: 16S rRNA (uracil(1498)-N(3))-methyltransferase [Pyrinomonadaceae bacterium]|nr:16S rRNA (uracil(1498)-N(3))-methyltransferase [Pyrinomonadaceae bacterium]